MTSLYIFQFITYPYVARVLGVTNIGICNYVQSIVQYFSLFSMLGIASLGVREIAKCNGDKEKLNATFSQLFTLNLALTLFVLAIYIGAVAFVPQFAPYRKLLLIGALQLLFNTFTVEWLFRGLEDFRYITVRTLFVRTAYVVSIFLFVRDSSDYVTYFCLASAMTVVNGLINWNYRRRFVRLQKSSPSSVWQHMKPNLFLGAQMLMTSLYTTFNIVWLGLQCGDVEVGYYSTANKIEGIIIALYSSVTMVLMPRISSMLEKHDSAGVAFTLAYSFSLLFAFVFPCIVFTEVYAEGIIHLVAGANYDGSILPMRIVTPLLFIIGLAQIFSIQILMPLRLDKQMFISASSAAATGLLCNFLLVAHWRSIGSAWVWTLSELVGMCVVYSFARRQNVIPLHIGKDIIKHAAAFLPLAALLWLIHTAPLPYWTSFAAGAALTLVYSHVALCYLVKNQAYVAVCRVAARKILHHKK